MTRIAAALIILSLACVACGRRAPSIDFGKAECAHCRMNVVDRQFAAAVVTTSASPAAANTPRARFLLGRLSCPGPVARGMQRRFANTKTTGRKSPSSVPTRATSRTESPQLRTPLRKAELRLR